MSPWTHFLGWFPAKFVEILDERSKEVTNVFRVLSTVIHTGIVAKNKWRRVLFYHNPLRIQKTL